MGNNVCTGFEICKKNLKIKNIDCSEEGVSEGSTILEPLMPP